MIEQSEEESTGNIGHIIGFLLVLFGGIFSAVALIVLLIVPIIEYLITAFGRAEAILITGIILIVSGLVIYKVAEVVK